MKHSIQHKEGLEITGNIFYSFIEIYPRDKSIVISEYFNNTYHFTYTDLETVNLLYEPN